MKEKTTLHAVMASVDYESDRIDSLHTTTEAAANRRDECEKLCLARKGDFSYIDVFTVEEVVLDDGFCDRCKFTNSRCHC